MSESESFSTGPMDSLAQLIKDLDREQMGLKELQEGVLSLVKLVGNLQGSFNALKQDHIILVRVLREKGVT